MPFSSRYIHTTSWYELWVDNKLWYISCHIVYIMQYLYLWIHICCTPENCMIHKYVWKWIMIIWFIITIRSPSRDTWFLLIVFEIITSTAAQKVRRRYNAVIFFFTEPVCVSEVVHHWFNLWLRVCSLRFHWINAFLNVAYKIPATVNKQTVIIQQKYIYIVINSQWINPKAYTIKRMLIALRWIILNIEKMYVCFNFSVVRLL